MTKPRIEIDFCTRCRWLLRAGWLAEELLSTFGDELDEVCLRPCSNGQFEVRVNGSVVWERKRDGGFPDAAQLKRLVRNIAWPGRALGHIDRDTKAVELSNDVDET